MKNRKIFSLILILFISQTTFAQFYGGALYHLKNPNVQFSYWKYYDSDYSDENEGLLNTKKRKNLGIKEISIKRTDKKGRYFCYKLTYNNAGKLLTSKSKKYERQSTYLNDTIETSRFTNRKGKTEEFKKVFENGRVILDERFEKGKLVSRTENTYLNKNLVNAQLLHKGKKYEMRYTFNEDNKLTRSEFYKKGKLNQSWVYECKPEGQILASNKTELISSKCEYREESADGSYSVFTRTISEGKPYLTKQTYSKDSIKISEERFFKDSILTYRSTLKIGETNTEYFNKKGKLTGGRKSIYNNETKTNQDYVYRRKGKLKRLEITKYNELGQNTLIEQYRGKKQKLQYMRIKKYDEKGNNILEEFSNNKNREIDSKRIKIYNENGTLKTEEYFSNGKLYYKREFEYNR